MLEIMTERCCLRPMTDADFPALCRYLQDPGVMYAYGHAFSDREVWDWLRRQQARYVVPGYGALAVELRETGEMIGQCGRRRGGAFRVAQQAYRCHAPDLAGPGSGLSAGKELLAPRICHRIGPCMHGIRF